MSRWRPVLALSAIILGWVVCWAAAKDGRIQPIHDESDLTDYYFYQSVAEKVGAGADYYDVAAIELPRFGFPTGSPFNWRTPLYAHVLGRLGGTVANQVALATLASVAAALAAILAGRSLGAVAGGVAGISVAASSVWWGDPEPPYYTETWVGLLILIAIASQGLGFIKTSFLSGAAALFFRELALPFVGLCFAQAVARRQIREATAWVACLLLYSVHLAAHITSVASHHTSQPGEFVSGWVNFGGLGFVLATIRMNYVLWHLPDWCVAIYLPMAIYGLVALGAKSMDVRWVLIGINGYFIAFAVVGKDFNYYWGWITSPTLALGFGIAPFCLTRLILQSLGLAVREESAWRAAVKTDSSGTMKLKSTPESHRINLDQPST